MATTRLHRKTFTKILTNRHDAKDGGGRATQEAKAEDSRFARLQAALKGCGTGARIVPDNPIAFPPSMEVKCRM